MPPGGPHTPFVEHESAPRWPLRAGEATIRKVCAWCKRDFGEIEPLDDPRPTHIICPDCLPEWQVELTVLELRRWRGVAALVIPGNREDILVRVWRAAGPQASFVVYPDRRRRQAAIPPVPERRRHRLSFMIAEWSVRRD